MHNFKIIGTGSYVPERIVTNEDMEKIVDTTDDWIVSRTGIKNRHVSTGESTWYMGKIAAERAIDMAGIKVEDIDMILVSTGTADYIYPSLSCVLQGQLGLSGVAGFDVSAACAGFVYLLDIADKYLRSGAYKNILLVSAERLTKLANYEDRSTCVLFGDGAAACVVTNQSTGRFLSSCLGCDGAGGGHITAKDLSGDTPFTDHEKKKNFDLYPEAIEGKAQMNGAEVFKFATKIMVEASIKALESAGLKVSDVDIMLAHQANARIINHAVRNLKIDPNKVISTIREYGNTSSSSIPIALDICNRQGTLKEKDKVLFVGFGAGLTYGAAVLEI